MRTIGAYSVCRIGTSTRSIATLMLIAAMLGAGVYGCGGGGSTGLPRPAKPPSQSLQFFSPSCAIAGGANPQSIAIDPSRKFACVTNSGSNDVTMYNIDGTNGALKLIGIIGT